MINISYRLIAPRLIRPDFIEENCEKNEVLVKPLYLSICAADQRYYTGQRDKKALAEKLPMALIHEGVGEVVFDPSNKFKKGATVVMIPNTPTETSKVIKENYLRSSKFRASGFDGFMQNFVKIASDRIIEFKDIDLEAASVLELFSVVMNSLEQFELKAHKNKDTFGIWGNGNLGFIATLVLKKKYPKSKIIIFGTSREKLEYFSLADETFLIDEIPENLRVDHAFECVGGLGAPKAINQIIDFINPQGVISLLGVSENPVPINTRMVLEKGLTLIGHSRSSYNDFFESVQLLEKHKDIQKELKKIISSTVVVRNIDDMHTAFETDLNNQFKTVMKWEV